MTPLLIDTYFPNYAWLRKVYPEVYGFNVVSFNLSSDDATRMIVDFIVEKLENNLTVVITLSEDKTKAISMDVYNGAIKLGSINHVIQRFIYSETPKPTNDPNKVEKVRRMLLVSLRIDSRTKDHPYLKYTEYPAIFSNYVLGDSHDK